MSPRQPSAAQRWRCLVAALVALALIALPLGRPPAEAQVASGYEVVIASGVIAPDGVIETTITMAPGTSDAAAFRGALNYDASAMAVTGCEPLTGLGACNMNTAGTVRFGIVEAAGWATDTDLFSVTFTALGQPTSRLAVTGQIEATFDRAGMPVGGIIGSGSFGPRGDADCDGRITLFDARAVAQGAIGARTLVTTCPLPDAVGSLFEPGADVDATNSVTLFDARLIAQCAIGVPNPLCPNA